MEAAQRKSQTVPTLGLRTFVVAVVSEGLYVLGSVTSLIAMSLGYASLVSALAGLQHFFVFVYMLLLSLFVPTILKEETSRNVLALKIGAIVSKLIFVNDKQIPADKYVKLNPGDVVRIGKTELVLR